MRIFICFLFFNLLINAQHNDNVDVNYFYGSILKHNSTVKNLINQHPEGLFISFNKSTYGKQNWAKKYNYPEYGLSFQYQNFHNPSLGNTLGIYAHMNFYFFNRNLIFRFGQGIGYTNNPYDKESNFRNLAFSTHFMSSTYFALYHKQKIYKNIYAQAGLQLLHFSNANIKAPNTSTNTLAGTFGLNYEFEKQKQNIETTSISEPEIDKKIHYSLYLRASRNESDIIGSGQFPYYNVSAFAEKQVSQKSKINTGVDIFWAKYLEEYIYFKSVAYPNENVDANTDYRRVGAFIGHELLFNKVGVLTQVGYYVYSPFKFLGPLYQRVGFNYHFSKNISAGITLKTHAAKAEVVEFGLGYTL
jgi:hypothetical protein